MMEKRALLLGLGAGLLGLAGGVGLIGRLNRSSKFMSKIYSSFKNKKGWNSKLFQDSPQAFYKFLARQDDGMYRNVVRDYINYAHEGAGGTMGRMIFGLAHAPGTYGWLARKGLVRLPKQLRDSITVNATGPEWMATRAPGQGIHYREFGKGKVNAFRHWFAEANAKSFKNFGEFSDEAKAAILRLDDDIAAMRQVGHSEDKILDSLVGSEWLQPHLKKMTLEKTPLLNPFSGENMTRSLQKRDVLDQIPFSPDKWATPEVSRFMAGSGTGFTGLGAVGAYREATKPWYEKWKDNLDEWIS